MGNTSSLLHYNVPLLSVLGVIGFLLIAGTVRVFFFGGGTKKGKKEKPLLDPPSRGGPSVCLQNLDVEAANGISHVSERDDIPRQSLTPAPGDQLSNTPASALVPNRLRPALSSVYPQRSHHPTEMAHTDLGSPFSDLFQDTNVETDHGPPPQRETVVYSPSTPGGRDDGDLAGSVPTPIGVTEGATTPEKTSRPSSFIPSTPVSACYDSDGISLKTSSTLPPSYRTRRSIPDLISAPQHPLPPLPNQNNYPRAPPSAYPGTLEFYQRPSAVVELGEALDDRQVLPDVPDHGGDSDDERRGGNRNGSQARHGRKRCTDGGIRLDGGPVGYVPTLQSPAVDFEDGSQAGSTRPPSYN
ncbi:hypothetical protein C8Q74DRAFT_983625 [Fomes fomentarius]|nr:hypothetical protein C8Q74DRAFT_983625 [Fomes fomentarius]